MRHSKSFFPSACLLVMFCVLCLSGCKKEEKFQTVFPLDAEVVTDTLETVGLRGAISESETISQTENNIHYVVRDETEQYADTDNNKFVAGISSTDYKDGRILSTVFNQDAVSNQFAWEDWKKQIVFATMLYGGFENEEDVYQAFLEKELPEDETSFSLDMQFPDEYCVVAYRCNSQKTYDEDGFEVKKHSASMAVQIYESFELYQEAHKDIDGRTAGV